MQHDHDPDGSAWPPTFHPEYDGFDWVPSTEPSEEDRRWAASNLNEALDAADAEPPDDYYDILADEAEAISRLERGLI